MASSSTGKEQQRSGVLSPRSAQAQMEEALGKLDISEEEATPLSALRPAWGNPKGLIFQSLGENTFAAEFESKRDRSSVGGSPWHIDKHAVILQNFEEQMQPSELSFDRLPVWVPVVNLPYNLRNNKWGLAIA
ncbi:hypothetical protein ZWY2020_028184 [Hordeum vulgare]|nr:hypothetical protein ZWY2020_019767 [Hordeum vulgare]KAI5013230.1 hypothetical protein ZWY2020_028184 [Hordeum vulgare]